MNCIHIFKGGPREGQPCPRVVRIKDSLRCSIHNKNGKIKTDVPVKIGIIENEEAEIEVNKEPSFKFTPFKLDVDPLVNGNSICIIGASQSGKSTLMKYIIDTYYTSKKLLCFVFAENIHIPLYEKIRKTCIHSDKYRPRLIKAMHKIQKASKNIYPALFVLDDIVTEKRDKTISKLFLTLRNCKISSMALYQNPMLCDKTNRTNINIYLFKSFGSNESIEQILEYIKGYKPFYGLPLIEQINLYKLITNDRRNFIMLNTLNDTLTFHSIDLS